MEINSNAPVTSRQEITIDAPLESVWWVHREIDSWPQWNPDIAKAELTGPIAVGTVFRWETAVMEIPSTIGEVVPFKKLAWSGKTGSVLGILGRPFIAGTSRRNPENPRRLAHSVAFVASVRAEAAVAKNSSGSGR